MLRKPGHYAPEWMFLLVPLRRRGDVLLLTLPRYHINYSDHRGYGGLDIRSRVAVAATLAGTGRSRPGAGGGHVAGTDQ